MNATIIRVKHEKDYFVMSRATAQDENLSWAARGVLAYLLSKPDDWIIKSKDLEQGCKRDKVQAILGELEDAHYLTREEVRDGKWESGRWEYHLHERPYAEKPTTDNPPRQDFPTTVLPGPENPHHTYKREEQNTEVTDLPVNIANAHSQGPQPSKPESGAIPQSKESGEQPTTTAKAEEAATENTPPSSAVPPKAKKPPIKPAPGHAALLDKFIDAVGRDTLPPGFKFGPSMRFFKDLEREGYTEVALTAAGSLVKGWLDALPGKPTLSWDTGWITNTVRQSLTMNKSGITPERIGKYIKAKYAEVDSKGHRFWAGKLVTFAHVASSIEAWQSQPLQDVPAQPRWVEDPDSPGCYITPSQLKSRQIEKEMIANGIR